MGRIYFFVSEGTSILSKIIKWYQRGNKYTHSGVVVDMEDINNPTVLAALKKTKVGKFWNIHKGYFERQRCFKYYYIEVDDDQVKRFYSVISKYKDKGYDIRGILGFLLRFNEDDESKFFCSELVYTIFREIGVELLNNTEPYEACTTDLLKSHLVHEDKDLNNLLDNKRL